MPRKARSAGEETKDLRNEQRLINYITFRSDAADFEKSTPTQNSGASLYGGSLYAMEFLEGLATFPHRQCRR